MLDSYIDSNTGALILNLAHLLTFERTPRVSQMRKGRYQHVINPNNPEPDLWDRLSRWSSSDRFNLGFIAPEPLEIRAMRDHIFRLTMGRDHLNSLGETNRLIVLTRSSIGAGHAHVCAEFFEHKLRGYRIWRFGKPIF